MSIEFMNYDEDKIDQLIKWKKDGIPNDIPRSTRYKWQKKLEGFTIKNNDLFYEDVLVVRPSERDRILNKEYQIPVGSEQFYQVIRQKYYNISIRDIKIFLGRLEFRQLHAPIQKKEFISSNVVSRPNFTWSIDLIDMSKYSSKNKGINWLLNVVDLFSKYAVSIPLKDKTALSHVQGMNKVLEKFGTKPRTILSDNEFKSNEFKNWCSDNDIRQIFSKVYSPETNGAIERFNRTLKQILFKLMSRDRTRNYLKYLDKVMDFYNEDAVHSSTGFTPEQIVENPKLINQVKKRLEEKAMNRELSSKSMVGGEDIEIGDKVRVSLLTIPEFKKNEKVMKRIGINWSQEIFTIYKVFVSRNKPWMKPMFMIESDTEQFTRKYRRDELLKVNDNLIEKNEIYINPLDEEEGEKEEPVLALLPKKKIIKPAKMALEERKEEGRVGRTKIKAKKFQD